MTQNREEVTSKKNFWLRKAGISLVALSFLLYGGLLIVPFSPYAVGTKAAIYSALVISGEISFWAGSIILGKELVSKYRKHLNPLNWFKK